jgi:type I restriction enzyme, S subunit
MTDKWPSVELSSIAEFRNGLNYTQAARSRGGLPIVGVKDFQSRSFVDFAGLEELDPTEVNCGDLTILKGDILFVRSNGNRQLIGRSLLVREAPVRQTTYSGFTIRLRFTDQLCDPRFFAYVLRGPLIRQVLSSQGGGTNISNLNQGILSRLKVPQPTLGEQRHIASILGAYDELIEVNRRRIALLEEMTRQLFEEWFVHFRFPSSEGGLVDAPDGPLPDGWEWQRMRALCVQPDGIQTGPFGSQLHQSDYVEHGVPVVMPKNIIGLYIVEDGIARISEEKANELGRHRMSVGDVVYGRRGEIGRRAFISPRENGWFCGTGCLRLRPDIMQVRPRYFFDALGLPTTLAAIRGRAQGATMPNLSAGAMSDVPVMVPPLALQAKYEEIVGPLAASTANIQSANVRLALSRDLLLPRLISGDVSVTTSERELEAVA